jgi:hypothetical protein
MVRPITVEELLGARADFHAVAATARTLRCVALGDVSLTFENRHAVLATLSHIVVTEGVSDPDALQAECDVYNALLPDGGVSVCLQVDGIDPQARRATVQKLLGFERYLWLVIGEERRPAHFDGPLSARQHVRFELDAHDVAQLSDAQVTVVLDSDHPEHSHTVELPAALRRALVEDLTCDELYC